MITKQESINIDKENETVENDQQNWPQSTGEVGDLL